MPAMGPPAAVPRAAPAPLPIGKSEASTPSREDGVEAAEELQLRAFGAELVLRVGALLRLPQLTLASAAIMLQRFYSRRSLAEVDIRAGAAGAVMLTCKLAELPRKLQDVVVVSYRVQMRELRDEEAEDSPAAFAASPTPGLEIGGREYTDFKQEVVRAERHIFRDMGFDIMNTLDSAHGHALQYLEALGRPSGLSQRTFNYLNDSLRTTLCCEHRSSQIATAAIYLAARTLKVKLPSKPVPWWNAIGADAEAMQAIAKELAALYRRPPAEYIYIPRKRREKTTTPLPPQTPAETPFTPFPSQDLLAPSPQSDGGDGGESGKGSTAANGDAAALDPGRVEEMLAEDAAAAAAAAAPAVMPVVPANCGGDAGRRSDRGRGRNGKARIAAASDSSGRSSSERQRRRRGRKRTRADDREL